MKAWNAKERKKPADEEKGPRIYKDPAQFAQHWKLAKERLLKPSYNAKEDEPDE